jgi:hypothetical protein
VEALLVSDQIDSSTVHPARRYNYWLGGKDGPSQRPDPAHVAMYGAVGSKP